ncbi:MAG: diphthine synthase [Methanosaeta sp. NSM2]|nr:dphB [Methanomicrobia archaeon]MDD1732160.1 diphthine synthase [Methanothrix sp.]OYV11713.1 MAG: diphthine synthase [Methanosaeta sp. NSM2]
MLTFIGLGLFDERDISVKGREAVAAADMVYAEFYTSRLMGTSLARLEKFHGKKIHLLTRSQVEVEPFWLEQAKEMDVAFLVGGDAMVSTTHLDLRLRAMLMGIKTRLIHSSSIVTAVSGLSGLQNYRFGRSTTIPFPYLARGKRIVPETPYRVLQENLARNLHTMLFLDIQRDPVERYMTAGQGAALLLEMESEAEDKLPPGTLGIGIARAGSDDAVIRADRLSRLKDCDLGGPLHILVVPARLHFMEAEALRVLAAAPEDALMGAD